MLCRHCKQECDSADKLLSASEYSHYTNIIAHSFWHEAVGYGNLAADVCAFCVIWGLGSTYERALNGSLARRLEAQMKGLAR